MLYAANTSPQTVTSGAALAPGSAVTKTGCGVTIGAASVSLFRPGYYQVTVQADAATTGSSAADVGVQLTADGAAVIGAESTGSSSGADVIAPLGFTALVQVPRPCCPYRAPGVVLAVQATAAETVSNLGITVLKVG